MVRYGTLMCMFQTAVYAVFLLTVSSGMFVAKKN